MGSSPGMTEHLVWNQEPILAGYVGSLITPPNPEGDAMAVSMDECIRNCTECHIICLKTVTHCLGLGGKHADQAYSFTSP